MAIHSSRFKVFKAKSQAALIHLGCGAAVIGLVVGVLYHLWFPAPYGGMVAATGLLLILAVCDVICGPLLTLVVYHPRKSLRERWLDASIVVLIQLCALGYGVWTMAQARPVYVVFEVDRFRVITAAEIDPAELPKAPSNFRELSWSGPRWIATRAPRNSDELLESINLSLSGLETSLRPDWWESLEQSKSAVQRKLQTVERLVSARPQEKWAIERVLSEIDAKEHVAAEHIRWLPVVSSKSNDWVVFVERKSLKPLAALPIDGFIEN